MIVAERVGHEKPSTPHFQIAADRTGGPTLAGTGSPAQSSMDPFRSICAGIIFLAMVLALGPRWRTLPGSVAIAIWVTGSCWAVAGIAYFLDVETKVLAPIVAIGVATGIIEWLLRRKK